MSAGPPKLERRYRRLLFAYSPSYRQARGDEIVATLLDVAGPGRHTPSLAEAADLIVGGLRQRLALASIAGFDAGLAVAAPLALTLAAGISAFAWWRVEPVTEFVPVGTPLLGVFRTLGPLAYAAWLLAAAGRVVLRPAASRTLIAAALAVTVALPLLAPLTGVDRPPLWMLMALVFFGLLAFAGGTTPVVTAEERLRVIAGVVAVAVCASAVTLVWPIPGREWSYYYQPTVSRVGVPVTVTVGVVAAIAAVRLIRGRPAASWLWAAVLLGLPSGWLGPFDPTGVRLAADPQVPHLGRLAQVLLASCVAGTAAVWLAQIRTPGAVPGRGPDEHALARTGAAAFGCAAGLAVYLLPLAVRRGHLPATVGLTLAALAAIGLVATGAGGLVATGAGGLVATGARPVRRSGRLALLTLGVAALAYAGAVVVGAYDRGWQFTDLVWNGIFRTAGLVGTIALVPLALCALTAVRVLAGRPSRPRLVPFAVLVLSAGWLGYLILPYGLSWGPALVMPVAGVAVLAARRVMVGVRQD
ncbi:MAG: hypothetical protein ACM30G_13645 [Micromonosporaceae bacterium]